MKRSKIYELLAQTHNPDARVRREALLKLCPCHVRADVADLWDRMLEMQNDADASVRSLVFHALCDGSPSSREAEVVAAVEAMQSDSDRRLRRRARAVMAAYRRTGKINQL